MSNSSPQPKQLLLSAKEAAKALGICERTLWELKRRGELVCIRVGTRTLYDPRDLTAWIDRQKQGGAA